MKHTGTEPRQVFVHENARLLGLRRRLRNRRAEVLGDPICLLFDDCCEDVCQVCAGVWPCPPINPADLTGDNVVGVADLLILLADWGDCPNIGEHCPDPAECPADFDENGSVGVGDLLFLLQNWG